MIERGAEDEVEDVHIRSTANQADKDCMEEQDIDSVCFDKVILESVKEWKERRMCLDRGRETEGENAEKGRGDYDDEDRENVEQTAS